MNEDLDEEFWNSKEISFFDFDKNEGDKLFGVSIELAENVKAGISELGVFEDSFRPDERKKLLKPLSSVISDVTLAKILDSNKSQFTEDDTLVCNPNATLESILLGRPYSMEGYKSLMGKTNLLDAAIKSGNGNAILGVTLFAKKTLKTSLFHKILFDRQSALDIYLRYLIDTGCKNEICDLLTMQNRPLDAALICLEMIIRTSGTLEHSVEPLFSKINKHYSTFFSSIFDSSEAAFVRSYIRLLDWQKETRDKFTDTLPYGAPALKCLFLTCRDFWGISENNMLSPISFAQNQDISPQHYLKVAITSRASVHSWDDIDNLLHKKGWLGGKKLQTNLPIKEVIKILQNHKAPPKVLEKFLGYVDVTKRLQLAKSLGCHRAVANILASQGDRTALLEYKSILSPQSEDHNYTESVLQSGSIRWKN